MSLLDDLVRLIQVRPGVTTAELAAATNIASAAALALLRHEPSVEIRGRRWYPAALVPPGDRPGSPMVSKAEHPATLKAARVVLAEVGGLLCGALALPLPEHPPTLPEIKEMIRDLHQRSVRQLAHALGEIADPVREGEMLRLLGKVRRMHAAVQGIRERLGGAIEAGTEILDLLAEERSQ